MDKHAATACRESAESGRGPESDEICRRRIAHSLFFFIVCDLSLEAVVKLKTGHVLEMTMTMTRAKDHADKSLDQDV